MKKDIMTNNCTIRTILNFIGKKWTLLILLELYKNKRKWRRFGEIKKNLEGITPKMLSLRLKELQNAKLINNAIDSSKIPITSSYCLTPYGFNLIKYLVKIKDLRLNWNNQEPICKNIECRSCNN